ncbi:50S ribosomal protein L35 [Blattabacterium cuenoti]|uniref:50S ribosomal protein L35 n=1 Tax=Blattabacterium cuenoti TaxID=1653831 RepID=UPI00163D04CC|nr:50S ribosomal protein L35 [Blattabacterium cuenoti]
MTKLKTKSGSKKRFRRTSSGNIKRRHSYKSHLLTKKSKKRKRHINKFYLIKKSDKSNINRQI